MAYLVVQTKCKQCMVYSDGMMAGCTSSKSCLNKEKHIILQHSMIVQLTSLIITVIGVTSRHTYTHIYQHSPTALVGGESMEGFLFGQGVLFLGVDL